MIDVLHPQDQQARQPSFAHKPAVYKHAVYKHFHRIAWLAVMLTFGVIVFGAFVRLSHAGLSCPDWPTCYGRAAWPTAASEVSDHAATTIRKVEPSKAWREQAHRHAAFVLGLLVLTLTLLAVRRRRFGVLQVLGAAALIGTSIVMYIKSQYTTASVLATLGELWLLIAALRWNNEDYARATTFTLMLIVFQALLGMWTVTWLLKPIVVMGHLLGGMTTLAMLTWIAWRATDSPVRIPGYTHMRRLLIGALVVIGIQIGLGGWVSANYAALACGNDFPTCVGQWLPSADFREGFVLWRGIGVDYEGGVLDGEARIAIQLAHRMMAVMVVAYLSWLVIALMRTPGLRWAGSVIAALTLVQTGLGIANVMLALPLSVAVAHNGVAALLLSVIVGLLARLRPPG